MKGPCIPWEEDMQSDSMAFEIAGKNATGIHTVYRPIDALTHPKSAEVQAFWDARPVDGIVIGRDVPSRIIASLLSHIIVHEPINGGGNLKVRIAGTAMRRRFGDDITRKTLSDLFPGPDFQDRLKSVLTAIETGAPQFADCHLSNGSFEILHSELEILPVFARDRISKWAMTVVLFFD